MDIPYIYLHFPIGIITAIIFAINFRYKYTLGDKNDRVEYVIITGMLPLGGLLSVMILLALLEVTKGER